MLALILWLAMLMSSEIITAFADASSPQEAQAFNSRMPQLEYG
jgi:hypothetical protein